MLYQKPIWAEDGGSTMGLKALKEYGLKFKELKEVSKEMNEVDLAPAIPIKVGTKGESMLLAFMDAIEAVEDKKVKDIPEKVSTYYDNIPQEAFDDDDDSNEGKDPHVDASDEEELAEETEEVEEVEEAEEAEEAEKEEEIPEVTSDCPSFLTGCDDKEPDCQECKKDTVDEYNACKKATDANAKVKKEKKTKAKKGKKNAGKRTRYGHMPSSMAGFIDDMVYEGATKEDMVKVLVSKFKRTKEKAQSKVNSHLGTLATKKGITIKEKKDGGFKAKEKYAEGLDKNNTVVASK